MVMRILGIGGGSSEKRVGNLRARELGVRSRLVLVVEGALLAARCLRFADVESSLSSSLVLSSESSMLSASSSGVGSFCSTTSAASAASIRRRLSCSTSTLTFSPSLSTSSHTRFLSIVIGTFLARRSLLNSGSRSSSLFRLNLSSRRRLSRAFFCLTCRSCLLNLLSVLNGRVALVESGLTRFAPIF